MPLPKEPFTIRGGCNCKAIRYQVSVPPFSDRPPTPYRTGGVDVGDSRIPAVYIDHCNDCRRATSAILPVVLVADVETVRASLLPNTTVTDGMFQVSDMERDWCSASEIFDFRCPSLKDTFLAVYKSTLARSRWFCSRCGTMIAYSVDPGVIPESWGWPTMLDIWQGTVDREDLEKEYMAPERMLWCEMGIPWIRKMSKSGAGGIPEHPLTKIDKLVGDDTGTDSRDLNEIR